jgi:hypothetical protein
MKTRFLATLCVAAIAAVAMTSGVAATCSAKSGAQTAALIELYTSEGCDSCPPADRWLSGLKATEVQAGRAVPLAMHVDYWDYIGWRDPYAQALFSARQREMSSINRAHMVYTPEILIAGKDFRPGLFSVGGETFDEVLTRVNMSPPRADLAVALTGSAERELKFEAAAKLRNAVDSKDAVLYVAVFESGLSSVVAAGENAGKLLKHDFVVREWHGPFAFDADGTLSLNRSVALKAGWKANHLGVATFVQNRGTGQVLQALQLASCNN